MKVLIQLAFCSVVFLGLATAQHRGGGGGGGSRGSAGGFSRAGGGGVSSFGHGGLVGGGSSLGFRGGAGSLGFRGGIGLGYRGFYGGYGLGFGLGYGPYYGYGYGYGYPYYDYYNYPYSYYPDTSYAYSYSAYQPSTTVVYPPSQPAYALPATRGYDQYGQQTQSAGGNESGSPIYLLAMKNHNIYAASSYSVDDATLHYVTIDHAEKQVPINDIDRDLTLRLNRERHVAFNLPMQQ